MKLRSNILISVIASLAIVFPVIPAQTAGSPSTSTSTSSTSTSGTYLTIQNVPGPVAWFLQAFGNRLMSPGNERTVLSGNYTDSNGTTTAQLTWQAPSSFRFDRTNRPGAALVYTPQGGIVAASALSTTDANTFESLMDDASEAFFYGFQNKSGTAHRFLGGTFRTDDGKTANYQGPWYTIYVNVGPAHGQPGAPMRQKLFQFDSTTRHLANVAYKLPDSTAVVTRYSNWTQNGSQSVPGQIVRTENGKVVFTFNVSQSTFGPTVTDNTFSAQ